MIFHSPDSEKTHPLAASLLGFFDSFPDPILIWSSGNTLVRANRAAEELLEHTSGELARDAFLNSRDLLGDDAASLIPAFLREEQEKGSAARTVQIQSKSGKIRRVEIRSHLLRSGAETFRYMVLRDLSSMPDTDPVHPRSGAGSETVSPTIPEILEEQELEFETDANGFFTRVNDIALNKCGFTRRDIRKGLPFTAVIIPEDRDRAHHDFERLQRTGRLDALEYTILRPDGSSFPVILSLYRGADPQYPGGVRGVAFDISEHKKIENDLLTREKLNALGELTSGVVHNFNNILSVILGYLALIPEEDMDESRRKIFHGIRKAATDGADMVKRIQNFSRPENSIVCEPSDLNGIIRDVLDYLSPRWIGVIPEVRMIPQLSQIQPVSVIPFEMREVLSNIVINALDAMPDGGTLTVKTFSCGDRVAVSVADTGVGMSESTKRRLFEPFFTTKKEKGTGVGLSVSRAIVSKFKGEIRVESTAGVGTIVTILLPVIPAHEDHPDQPAAKARPDARRILVLDDEENICEILREFLSRDGHEVVTAKRGERGLELLEESAFDILITDLNMPGVSGWDLARRVRGETPETRIIMLTGWGSQVEERNRREKIIDHILHKPIDFALLTKIIAEPSKQ